ncbi:MAG TPA: prephenate dehydrogenase/arogenate dehydrogenase family protein [Candidatus Saccharimonadales bacterium]|nr:prephenate dehydrogenase/arogenate dehydrogenase family protein [Candidatus Saccharimonadales bacterium]
MSFGVIGYGSFGKLLADILGEFGEVAVYSRRDIKKPVGTGFNIVNLKEAASKDVVILAVGLEDLDDTSRKLAGMVSPETIVVDVSSVKLKPTEILQKNLGGKCKILATHPLFGPQTVDKHSLAGRSIVVCSYDAPDKPEVMDFLKNKLELKVIEMSAEDHDREMAWVHGLTFFVGRGLLKLNPPRSELSTGYYQKLLDLVELENKHSIELFNTVQKGNPFAGKIRRELLDQLESIDAQIKGG